LFRYNPALLTQGKNLFQLDSKAPAIPLDKYIYNETRYTMLVHSAPQAAAELLTEAQNDVRTRWRMYEHMASMPSASPAEAAAKVRAEEAAPAEKKVAQ
jgi:pyruvate-ferredoxin/flavodoxin oxidoreductase